MSSIAIVHSAYDGTLTFKNQRGSAIGYAGAPGFIAEVVLSQGWRGYGSPSQQCGYFIAVPPGLVPEDLPIDPGFEGWNRLSLEDLLDFIGNDDLVV